MRIIHFVTMCLDMAATRPKGSVMGAGFLTNRGSHWLKGVLGTVVLASLFSAPPVMSGEMPQDCEAFNKQISVDG
ncbi:MAG: hypothetical protein WBN51_05205 [Gammaproteobacteria bacterium]